MAHCNMGRIHSFESFGAADGPGVRFVIFMQGCKMRCRYCHNPDSWKMDGGSEMTADELIKKALRYKTYWRGGGGITVSGGEPLLQIDFLCELFKKAKKEGIHTALDTSGGPFCEDSAFLDKFRTLMEYTDLVILDIKETNPDRCRVLTGFSGENVLKMAELLSQMEKPMWIRHVLVPGHTDFDEDLQKLGEFVRTLKGVERAEILPYHTLGRFKWESLGLDYSLDGISPPTPERIKNAERLISID